MKLEDACSFGRRETGLTGCAPLQTVDKQPNASRAPFGRLTTYRHCLLRLFCLPSFTSPAVVHPESSPALPSGARLLFRHSLS
jgi:hypothetical protein